MKILEILEKYLLCLIVILLPIYAFMPLTSFATLPKEILLVTGASLLTIIWALKMMIRGTMGFGTGKFDFAVLALTGVTLASALAKAPNKTEAFFLPGTVTFTLGGALLYYLANQRGKEIKNSLAFSLIAGATLLSLSILLTTAGIFAKIPALPPLMKEANFNPLGGSLPSLIFLTSVLPLLVGTILKQKDLTVRVFLGVTALIITLGIGISVRNILPGGKEAIKIPDTQTSWGVAVETLKTSPLWGAGPANYLTAFSRFRPLSYNQTDLWPLRFTTASNFYLTAITELGLAGIFALGLLFWVVYKYLTQNFSLEAVSLPLLLALFMLFPAIPPLLVILFLFLSLFSESKRAASAGAPPAKVPSVIAGVVVITGVFAILFFGYRLVAAETKYATSLTSLGKNDAKATLENLQAAIALNRNADRYHASLAQVNLAIASSLATKKDITDEDRNTIAQFIQAAIAEAKATVILNPQRAGNWEILARTYRAIMPFAQGADNFAIQSFTQAAALDPIDPNLRIALGGTYFALGRFDEAIDTFKLAVLAKPDLANAHYNLAIAYREKKDYKKATEEMNTVLSLVGKDSADYETALKELKNIESLEAPEGIKESALKPPLELPKEATPPATPAAE